MENGSRTFRACSDRIAWIMPAGATPAQPLSRVPYMSAKGAAQRLHAWPWGMQGMHVCMG